MTTSRSFTRRRGLLRGLCAAVAGLAVALPVVAQSYPERPIRVVLSTPAGGPIDVLARITGEAASRLLGQQILIDNKPGAGGAVAVNYLKQQPADGYTLYMTADATFSLIPVVRKMAYKPIEDFSFIGSLAFAPQVFAVPATLPVKSLAELVAKAKAEPGKLNYGMMLGVPQHLDFERFKRATASDIVLVPYTGGAPIVNALLADQVQVGLMNASLFDTWVKQGKLRALATTSKKRLATMPDVPTMAEAGFPQLDLDEGVSYVLVGPSGMPAAVTSKIYAAYAAALRDPEVRKRLEAAGYEVNLREGAALRADMVQDLAKNEKQVKALNIKLID